MITTAVTKWAKAPALTAPWKGRCRVSTAQAQLWRRRASIRPHEPERMREPVNELREDPVATMIPPELLLADVPLDKTMLPEDPVAPAALDENMVTEPDEVNVDLPERSSTLPPARVVASPA